MRVMPILAVVFACAVGAAQAADGQPPHHGPQSMDSRELVLVSSATRTIILTEMRGMLEALNGILHDLAAGNTDAAEKTALKTGTGAAMQPGAQMAMRELPESFRIMARAAHSGFDKLAVVLKSGGDKSAALKSVAEVTDACVACHAMYRFEERAAR